MLYGSRVSAVHTETLKSDAAHLVMGSEYTVGDDIAELAAREVGRWVGGRNRHNTSRANLVMKGSGGILRR